MRHNALMGVIAIVCCGVVASTLIGPGARYHYRSEKTFTHAKRFVTGLGSGYLDDGEDGPPPALLKIADVGTPRADLLLAAASTSSAPSTDSSNFGGPGPAPGFV